jgi:hypothetical protein
MPIQDALSFSVILGQVVGTLSFSVILSQVVCTLSFSVILSQVVGWPVRAKNPHEEQRDHIFCTSHRVVQRRGHPFVWEDPSFRTT